MMKVLFLDTVHPALEEALSARGFTCEHNYQSSHSELLQKIGPYTGIVVRSRIILDEAFIEAATNLRWVARSGSGLENIDLAFAKKRGVSVYSSPEGNRDAVGEHTVGMLLMLFNRLHLANAEVKSGTWSRDANRGIELGGLTVGIIGYGHMGRALAEKLAGFNCRILAYDKYKSGFGSGNVSECDLESIQRDADVVSLHLPLSGETRHYVNYQFIGAMRKPFFLINTARGQHVDSASLVRGLISGKVRGACLDVLEYEKRSLEGLDGATVPEPLQYLQQSDHVVMSPHVAGWTVESYVKLSKVLARKVMGDG